MSIRIVSLLFMLLPSLLISQEKKSNELLDQIPRIEQIDRLRSLMVDALLKDDFAQVAKIEKNLMELNDYNYIGLFPYEIMALDYLAYDFSDILPMLMYFDTAAPPSQPIIYPNNRSIGPILESKLYDRKESTIQSIQNASLEGDEKMMLIIHHFLMFASKDSTINQDSINSISKKLIKNHPNSSYKNYVTKNYLYEYLPSKWGLGLDFFLGYGTFDDKLGEQFGDIFSFGVAFEIQYTSFVLYLRDYIGFTKTRKDISFQEDTWEGRETALVFLPEATLGFEILNRKKIKLTPFAGISSLDLGPTLNKSDAEEYDKIDLDFTSAPCFGINLDIKMRPKHGFVSMRKPEESYGIIKIRYSYHNPNYSSRFDGALHTVIIGFGGFGRTLKRVQY